MNRGKLIQRRGTDLLGWRVWRPEFRMGLFQISEPAKELVIVCVTDKRVVEDVILEIVFLDLVAQLENFFLGCGAGIFRRGMGLVVDIVN